MKNSNYNSLIFSIVVTIFSFFIISFDKEGWLFIPIVAISFPFSIISLSICNYLKINSVFFIFINSFWWFFLAKLFFSLKEKTKYQDTK